MNYDFTDKNVLVTGGTRGIGLQLVKDFESCGAVVTITGTSEKSFDSFNRLYPNSKVDFLSLDFSDLDSLKKFIQKVRHLKFDIVINNAGINKINNFEDITLEDWQSVQDVNVRAPFLISQAASSFMRHRRWGRIINISSIYGLVTREQRLAYTTSKCALIGMTKNMALELARDNILVNAVSPGFVDTDLTRKILGENGIEEMIQKVPLKKLANARDISGIVLFLCSSLNGFITGQNIVVDGGFTCA